MAVRGSVRSMQRPDKGKEKAWEKENHSWGWEPIGEKMPNMPFPWMAWAYTLSAFPSLIGLRCKTPFYMGNSLRNTQSITSKKYKEEAWMSWGHSYQGWSALTSQACTACHLLNKSCLFELSWSVVSILCYKTRTEQKTDPTGRYARLYANTMPSYIV